MVNGPARGMGSVFTEVGYRMGHSSGERDRADARIYVLLSRWTQRFVGAGRKPRGISRGCDPRPAISDSGVDGRMYSGRTISKFVLRSNAALGYRLRKTSGIGGVHFGIQSAERRPSELPARACGRPNGALSDGSCQRAGNDFR